MADKHNIDQKMVGTAVCEFISTSKLSEPASRAKVVTFNDLGDLAPQYLLKICAYIDKQHEQDGNPVSSVMIRTHLKSGKRIHVLRGRAAATDFESPPQACGGSALYQMVWCELDGPRGLERSQPHHLRLERGTPNPTTHPPHLTPHHLTPHHTPPTLQYTTGTSKHIAECLKLMNGWIKEDEERAKANGHEGSYLVGTMDDPNEPLMWHTGGVNVEISEVLFKE